ncbi:MAG TPA: Gfo/Idh/MocA family oxidoreductase [Planctomycetes bacterium]|nr:Gfo/Idh/MocA family oxidoreductase [Planctomycetota bacterium]
MCCTTRRQFLRRSAAGAALGGVVPYLCTSRQGRAGSANDRLRIAAIGVGGRGMAITRQAARFGDVVAVCDADRRHAELARKAFDEKPRVYQDYRELLEREDIDVVINATPDHWHTLINVAALKAGKDVYTEKPLTLTVEEGKLLRRVVQQAARIVQVGTQQRSERPFQTAVELVRNGRIGQLRQVWVALPYFSTKGGPFSTEPVPEYLDWDLYQGQAPQRPYCRQRTHKNFRWWYEYAGGIITDWGNHHMDVAHWGMDCELTGPVSVEARGLFPNRGRPQCYNTPDRFFARMEYPNGVELLYFAALNDKRLYGTVAEHQPTTEQEIEWLFGPDVPQEVKSFNRNGIMFIGDRGRVFVNRGGVHGKAAEELEENPLPEDAWRATPSRDHMANFFDAVKQHKEPVSPVRIQHRTVTACHLTNISLRLGRKIVWDPAGERIVGDDEAQRMLSRPQRPPYQINV